MLALDRCCPPLRGPSTRRCSSTGSQRPALHISIFFRHSMDLLPINHAFIIFNTCLSSLYLVGYPKRARATYAFSSHFHSSLLPSISPTLPIHCLPTTASLFGHDPGLHLLFPFTHCPLQSCVPVQEVRMNISV